MFVLQLGKILIALTSPTQLISIMDHDLPYLPTEKQIKQCLNNGKCQDVRIIIGSFGKNPTKGLNLVFILLPDARAWQLSQHPLHIVENHLVPNAFIPFCSFRGDMNITGKTIKGLGIPVCNGFWEDTIDGRLCYTLHVITKTSGEGMPMLSGKGKGLVLAVDKGFSIQAYNHRMSDGDNSL